MIGVILMGYKPLNRPNNFMLGNKPWYPAIYDENITPLEQMNKLAAKLNEIIGDDTNVKHDVDKLLGVWKDVFMAKAGYVAPIETIYSENPLKVTLNGYINGNSIIENQYIDISDRYKPITLQCKLTEDGEPINIIWEFFNGNNYSQFQTNINVKNATATVYLPTKGNDFHYRVKCQNKQFTTYEYLTISIIEQRMLYQVI